MRKSRGVGTSVEHLVNIKPRAKSSIAALVAAIALALVPLVEDATALTETTTLNVAAAVDVRCTIVVGTLTFTGEYISNQPVPLDAQSTVAVACEAGRKVSIKMGQGLYPAPGSTNNNPLRRMANGSHRLTYQIYEDAAHTVVWDNRLNAVKTTRVFPYVTTIYGRIPALQTVSPGTYSDTVVATVIY